MSEPTEPTTARPGTAEKIRVLEQRASLGLDLWHPDDPTSFGPTKAVPWKLPEVAGVLEDG